MRRYDGYQESEHYVVTWCVGHLITMSYPEVYDEKYKRWSLATLPFIPEHFLYEVIPGVKKQYEIVSRQLNREDVARRDRGKAVGFLVAHGLYEKAYEWMEGLDPERTEETILLRLCSRLLENGLFTGKSRMLRLAYSAFRRGKYDAFVLEELVEHFRGSCRDMEQVRDAAVNFSVDDYPITEALIVCLLYTGQNVMERSGLLKNYLRQGGKSELAAAFLHRCSGLYLMKEVRMDPCILKEMGAAAARREPLSDMCALAYLDYYARHRDERCGEVDRVITGLGGQLMEKDMKLPLFKEYVDIL